MTAKRYHKLFGALMSQIMKGSKGAGRCIRAARHATPKWDILGYASYKEAWESLCQHELDYSVVRQYFAK